MAGEGSVAVQGTVGEGTTGVGLLVACTQGGARLHPEAVHTNACE